MSRRKAGRGRFEGGQWVQSPPLPKPIVTYGLCPCRWASRKRMPIRKAQDVTEEFRLRSLLEGLRVLAS